MIDDNRTARWAWLGIAASLAALPGGVAAQSADASLERRVREVHAAARPLDAHAENPLPPRD